MLQLMPRYFVHSTCQWRASLLNKIFCCYHNNLTPMCISWRLQHSNFTQNNNDNRNGNNDIDMSEKNTSIGNRNNFNTDNDQRSASTSSSFINNNNENDGGGGADLYIPSLRSALPPNAAELPQSTFLKCIEKQIMDEKLRLDRQELTPPVPLGWKLHHPQGTSLIYGRRLWFPPQPVPQNVLGWDFQEELLNKQQQQKCQQQKQRKHQQQQQKHSKNNNEGYKQRSKLLAALPTPTKRRVEKHFIRIQLTTRDASLDPQYDIRGEHFPFSFFVQSIPFDKLQNHEATALEAAAQSHDPAILQHAFFGVQDSGISLFQDCVEAKCDVVEGELVVKNLVFHGAHHRTRSRISSKTHNTTKMQKLEKHQQERDECDNKSDDNQIRNDRKNAHQENTTTSEYHVDPDIIAKMQSDVADNGPFAGFQGPDLDEAEEEVLDGIQSWLAERNIDDQFGQFVGQYSVWVEQQEYERWLQHLRDYVAA